MVYQEDKTTTLIQGTGFNDKKELVRDFILF